MKARHSWEYAEVERDGELVGLALVLRDCSGYVTVWPVDTIRDVDTPVRCLQCGTVLPEGERAPWVHELLELVDDLDTWGVQPESPKSATG